jgi:hypothetical protein
MLAGDWTIKDRTKIQKDKGTPLQRLLKTPAVAEFKVYFSISLSKKLYFFQKIKNLLKNLPI